MPTYVVPQARVFQDFTIIPVAVANPLRAHISGPHAKLIRYAETDEREFGHLGYYDNLLDTDYLWPNRPAGGAVDNGYVKLWIKDALLKYFTDLISSGSVITKTSGYNNRIRSASVNFKTNGAYSRHSSLYDRDVARGDIAKVRGLNSDNDPVTLWTYVKAIHGDPVAATIDSPESDADNQSTQGLTATVSQTAGALNCVTASVSGSAYDGLVSGYVNETYRVIVTESSAGGDYTTARLRVISGSGEDDEEDVTPAAAGNPTAIGARGLTLTFNEIDTAGCSASAAVDDVSADDLIAGQEFLITVNQAFTEPTVTSGGTYVGIKDTIYVVTVSRGGSLDNAIKPQILVSTTTGYDISGPTTVTAASTEIDVGTKGVTIEFNTTHLRKGDRFYVTVTAEAEGPMRTIELGHNLDSDIAAGSQVDLTLFIKKPLLQVEKNRTGFAPITNWDTSETQFSVVSGIVAYDATWTDGGEELPMDVIAESSKSYGKMYVETRYWLPTLAHDVYTISDVGDIDTQISGPLHPDNPLKWGVFKALENANGTEVKYTAIANPDDADSWVTALEQVLGRDDVYHLVPLTRDRTVLDLYAAHVQAQSSPEMGLFRVLWTNLSALPEVPLMAAGSSIPGYTTASTTDGEVALAVVEDDPDTSGTQYTRVRFTSGNVELLTAGVRAGDIVRLLYTSDGFGNETYTELVIDDVESEDQVRVVTGLDVAVSVPAKAEIWRNLTATEEAEALAIQSGSWGSRRIRSTWPNLIESSGTVMEGYFMNCSLAGLCSGVLPHQGLTHLEIVGYTHVPQTNRKFNRAQLDAMALGGTWIVTQDLTGLDTTIGKIFTRHALTTGSYDDINEREESFTRNVDSVSYRLIDTVRPFIGVTNVTPAIEARLKIEINDLIRTLIAESSSIDLGGQLIDGTTAEVRPHIVYRDRYTIKLNGVFPYPFNNADIFVVAQ